MKLGLITGEYPPQQGGVGDYTRELALALAALDVEVHVICGQQSAISNQQSTTIIHPIIRHWSFPSLLKIRSLAQSLNLSILNLQYQAAAYDLSAPIHFLPDLARVKTVVTFHDLRIPYLFPKAGPLRPRAVTHLARAASGVIVTDPADEAELKRRGGVKRLTQIPIGSNIAPNPPAGYDRASWRAAHRLVPDDFLLAYFGFLNESKGGDALIEALALLKNENQPVKLALVGGQTGTSDSSNNAAFSAELAARIQRHNLSQYILQTGFVSAPEVSAWLFACDAVALPYRDGASFRRGTLMAALAHGCAIITTQPATPLPALRDGVNVRLIPPDNAAALAQAVTELQAAPELRARLGAGARELSREFAWDKIAACALAFYQSL
jgi:glycosyltransferase involved in cell wall biosynthesis